jgi:hypothetical protein
MMPRATCVATRQTGLSISSANKCLAIRQLAALKV